MYQSKPPAVKIPQTIRIRQIFTNFRQRDFAGVALTLQGPQSPRRLLL